MKPFVADLKINSLFQTHRLIIPLSSGVGSPYLGKDFNQYYKDDRLKINELDLYSKLEKPSSYEKSNFKISSSAKRNVFTELFELAPSFINALVK